MSSKHRRSPEAARAESTKDTSATTTTLSSAREDLAAVLGKQELRPLRSRYTANKNTEKIMVLLREHHQLSSMAFGAKSRHFSRCLYPLWFAVLTRFPVEYVEEIYNIYPDALLKHGDFPDEFDLFPFHEGCGMGLLQDGPILRFLLKMNPGLLQQKCRYQRTPLEHYVSAYRRGEFGGDRKFPSTVRTMLEHSRHEKEGQGICSYRSEDIFRVFLIEENVDEDTMVAVFGSPCLPSLRRFAIHENTEVHGGRLSMKHAKAISLILPKVEYLRLNIDIDSDALECLLRALVDQNNPIGLAWCSIKLLPWVEGHAEQIYNRGVTHLLQKLIANNGRSLKLLELCRNLEDNNMDDAWFSAFADSPFPGAGALDRLNLEKFSVNNFESFVQFLRSSSAPKALYMLDFKFLRTSMPTLPPAPCFHPGNLTHLSIGLQHPYESSDLLKIPALVPSLKEFDLSGARAVLDITETLCDLLQYSTLERLSIKSFTVDVHTLSEVLLNSTVESVTLNCCNFVGMWVGAQMTISQPPKLKEIRLYAKNEKPTWWAEFINLVSTFPTLRTLWLRQQNAPFADISQPVKQLLAGSDMTTLTADGHLNMEIDSIRDELASNTTLRELCIPRALMEPRNIDSLVSVLEHTNYSIELVVSAGYASKERQRLEYLTDLNAHGRGRAACATTSRREFVDLLCSVNSSKKELGCKKIPKHCILYGLLSMAPGLWSGEGC